jgi:uncharacterized protein
MRILATIPFESDSGNQYLYDDNTGMVFPAADSLNALLELHAGLSLEQAVGRLRGRYDIERLAEDAEFIRHWNSVYGAFYRAEEVPPELGSRMRNLTSGDVEDYLDASGTRQLILILTEDCNLRCRYCAYSDEYPLNRNRTSAAMSVEIGRRAIDQFFERAIRSLPRNPWQRLAVTFYGGEPLLAHDTLRTLVAHAEATAPCPLQLAVTTNGTLLSQDLAGFLVDHNFSILVSLDGDRANHDRNRVFADGRGSFDAVVENLRRFRQQFPTYARIHLITVIDWGTDVRGLDLFFEEHKDDLPELQRAGGVTMEGTRYYDRFSDEEHQAHALAIREAEGHYFRAEADGTPPHRVGRLLWGTRAMSLRMRRRGGNGMSGMIPFSGACVPGSKLAVRVDGSYDMCERVNGTMPIGHVDTGIDVASVASIVRDYNAQVGSACWACPATKLCGLCMAAFNRDGRFERAEEPCRRAIANVRRTLTKVYSVLEARPSAFAEFRDIDEEVRFITS